MYPFLNKYFVGWKFFDNFEFAKQGRILLIWNPLKVYVTSIIERHIIHYNVTCLATNISFSFSLCYGLYEVTVRRKLWESLTSNVPLDRLALLAGDFNCVLNLKERIGGRIPLEKVYYKFYNTCGFLGL